MRSVLCAVALAASSPLFLLAGPVSAQMGQMEHMSHDAPAPVEQPRQAGTQGDEGTAGGAGDDQPGEASPPPIPTDNIEDRFYDRARMQAARHDLAQMGNMKTSALLIDQLEYHGQNGRDGYSWDAQAWYGSDRDRVAFATEGEGSFGKAERIETALTWRHAIDPYFDIEAGLRQDFRPDPKRTYALIGVQGLAPYWFELKGQMLISNKGEVRSRLTVEYEQRITQSLILQPEAEIALAFQDSRAIQVGSGLERFELGARLRYEIRPGMGPYVGLHWERKTGRTADLARDDGERASAVSFVTGFRVWL